MLRSRAGTVYSRGHLITNKVGDSQAPVEELYAVRRGGLSP